MAEAGLRFRDAGPDDASAVAALHVASWQAAYRGELPDAYLDGALVTEKSAHWERKLAALAPDDLVLLAEDATGLAGFVAIWPDRKLVDGAFIDNLHAAPDRHRQGIGRRLMLTARDRLVARGVRQAWLTVFPDNTRAVAFYQAIGGRPGLLQVDEIGGAPCAAQAYYWLDIREMGAA